MSRMREAAQAYRGAGLAVLPLQPAGKEPNFRALSRVQGSADWGALATRPASAPEIDAWFSVDPGANIGIICGQASGGVVVVDVDRPVTAAQLRHPPTVVAQTRRGQHLYFRTPRPVKTTSAGWGELRGDQAYTVAPPSKHEAGGDYYWLVSPEDSALADLDDVTSRDLALGTGTEPLPQYLPRTRPEHRAGSSELAQSEEAVAVAQKVLGIDTPLGTKFRCVLPGHGPDRHPSAALYRGPDGVWRYKDFHRPDDPGSLTLAEVLASQYSGHVLQLRGPELARWYRRLAYEAGLICVEPISLDVPRNLSRTARRLADGFGLLLALRALDDGGPAPHTRSFAARWCRMGKRQAHEGIVELRRHGVLVEDGAHGRTRLYLPGALERRGEEA